MELTFPEEEIISLIKDLEAGTCSLPCSKSDEVSPQAAADARTEGLYLKRRGDLAGANEKFIEMFHKQDAICSSALWSWAKILLLAKDFKHAQLLLHAEFANYYRGETWFNPFEWMNVHLNLPGTNIEWTNDGSRPNYKITSPNRFENSEQLVEKIMAYGGNAVYWNPNYSWAPTEHAQFVKYFGPVATLALDGEAYRWTPDEQDDVCSTD